MIISSTKYEHPKIHKITWTSPDQKYSQIDHVLITKRKQSSIKDVRSYRGACADSDHYMVMATIKQKIRKKKQHTIKKDKWNIQKLSNEEERRKYAEELGRKLGKQNNSYKDVEEEWQIIKNCIEQTAEEQLGKEKRDNKKEWYNENCHEIVTKEVSARLEWIRTKRDEDKKEYERTRNECNKVLRKNKREWIDNKIREIEKERTNQNTKSFYQKVNEQKITYKGKVNGIKNKEGQIVTNEKEYKNVWIKYYSELLCEPEIMTEGEEELAEDDSIKEPTKNEVEEILKKSANGKAPGGDGLNMELMEEKNY